MRMQLLMGTILSNGDEFVGVGFGVDEIPNENEVNETRYDTDFRILDVEDKIFWNEVFRNDNEVNWYMLKNIYKKNV